MSEINQYETLITREPIPNDPWTDIGLFFHARPWEEGEGTWVIFYARIQRHFGKHHLIASEIKTATLTVSRGTKELFSYDFPPEDCFGENNHGGVSYSWVGENGMNQNHTFSYDYFFFPDYFERGHYLFKFTIVPHEGDTVVLKYPVEIL